MDMAEEGHSTKEEKANRIQEREAEDTGSLIPDEIEAEDVDAENAEMLLMAQLQRHSGPLPAPETLAKYKEISPRAIDWIFEAATKEQNNRHWCDKEPLRQSRRAQTFTFTIAVLVIVVGAVLVYQGKSAQGLATILIPLASILGIFIYKEVKSVRSEIGGSPETNDSDQAVGKE